MNRRTSPQPWQPLLITLGGLISLSLLTLSFFPALSQPPRPGAPPWNFTPTLAVYLPIAKNRPSATPVDHLMITEIFYKPETGNVEWIEIFNPTGDTANLADYKVGDEETLGSGEGMLQFPPGAQLGVGGTAVIAANAVTFQTVYGFAPDYEFSDSGSPVPDMIKYTAWAAGSINLSDAGDEVLLLNIFDNLSDAVSWGSSNWAFNPDLTPVADGHSNERLSVFYDTDTAADWIDQPSPTPGFVDLTPPPTATPTPTQGPTPTPTVSPTPFGDALLISEVYFNPVTEPDEEWIELYNASASPIALDSFKLGDEETSGSGEGMYLFPSGSAIASGEVIVIANEAAAFFALYGFNPDYEFVDSDPAVPNMVKYTAWASGSTSLSNGGDEVLLLDAADNLVDAVSWGSSTWAFTPSVPAPAEGHSIERNPASQDTNTAADWVDQPSPDPGNVSAQ
jgi:hypothetical protein